MHDITRRDFLNGVALTIASGLTPAAQTRRAAVTLSAGTDRHARASSGLVRGRSRPARRQEFPRRRIADRGALRPGGRGRRHQRLGGGVVLSSGPPGARILILDNHDDFGGHAKRNEFRLDGRLVIGYGGSESLQSPRALYSPVAKGLLKALGVDVARFNTAFERELYPSLGLSRGLFFPREVFGQDKLVTGDPSRLVDDDVSRMRGNAKPIREFVAEFPISAASKSQLIGLFEQSVDPLAGKSTEEKIALIESTSYRDYLTKVLGCSEEVANCFQGRTLDFFAVGCDAVAASDARTAGYPGIPGAGPSAGRQSGAERALHLSFPGRQRVAGAAAGARADPRRRARQHDGRHRAGAVRLRQARSGRQPRAAAARQHLRACPQRAGRRRTRLYAARHRAPRGGAARRARLLQHADSLHHARGAGGAACGAGEEHQGAAGLHQRIGAQLAAMGKARRPRNHRRRCRPTARSSSIIR